MLVVKALYCLRHDKIYLPEVAPTQIFHYPEQTCIFGLLILYRYFQWSVQTLRQPTIHLKWKIKFEYTADFNWSKCLYWWSLSMPSQTKNLVINIEKLSLCYLPLLLIYFHCYVINKFSNRQTDGQTDWQMDKGKSKCSTPSLWGHSGT